MNNVRESINTYLSGKSPYWWAVLLFLVAVGLYWPSLYNGFVWDDVNDIVNNSYLHSVENIASFFSSDNIFRTRPLYSLSYYIDYKIWGLRPFGYHIENIILHGLNTVLLFFLLAGSFSRKLSVAASLVFAVHAVNTEAVDWILNRAGLLSTLFSLASLHMYLLAGKSKGRIVFYVPSMVFYVMAILSKESAIILPFIVFFYETLFNKEQGAWKKILYITLPMAVTALIYFWWWSGGAMFDVIRNAKYWGGSPTKTFLLMMQAFTDYVRLLVFPLDLRAWYIADKQISLNLHVLTGMGLLVFMIVAALWYRTKKPLITFSVVWFIAGLLPVSNIIPITGSMMAERWLYFPMIGFCIAAGAGFEYLYEARKGSSHKFQIAVIAIFILFLSLHSARVYERHKHWFDTEAMFKGLLAKNPDWAPGYNVLAVVYQHEGRYKKGLQEVLKAIELDPDYPLSYETLGTLLVDANRLPEAEAVFRKFYELKPDAKTGHVNFSIALMHQGKVDEARHELETALRISPNAREVHINFGYLYYIMDDLDKADQAVRKALSLNPGDIEAAKLLESVKSKRTK